MVLYLLPFVFSDDPKVWWWESTVAARKIGIAAIGVFGSSMGEMQVHITLCLIMAVIVLTAVVRPFGEQTLLQFLELGTLMATWMTLWAGTVFNSNPRCEDGQGGTIGWCDALAVLVGLFDIAMAFVAIVVVVYLTKRKSCDACCGRVKDETVGQRRRESIAREAEERRSRMESVDVTSFGNPSLDAEKVNGAAESSIEMTIRTGKTNIRKGRTNARKGRTNARKGRTNARNVFHPRIIRTSANAIVSASANESSANASGEQKVTDSVTSFTNPRLDAATLVNTQELSIDITALHSTTATTSDLPLPDGWIAHETGDGVTYYEHLASNAVQWETPLKPTNESLPPAAVFDVDATPIQMMQNPKFKPRRKSAALPVRKKIGFTGKGKRRSSMQVVASNLQHQNVEPVQPQHHTRDSTKLSPDWSKCNDKGGRQYYSNNGTQDVEAAVSMHVDEETGHRYSYNKATGHTQWLSDDDDVSEAPHEEVGESKQQTKTLFRKFVDDDGNVYYENAETGEVVWNLPEDGEL